jgi:hypothetical protein
LKAHPELHQQRVQARAAEDLKISGLGDLVLAHREKI